MQVEITRTNHDKDTKQSGQSQNYFVKVRNETGWRYANGLSGSGLEETIEAPSMGAGRTIGTKHKNRLH